MDLEKYAVPLTITVSVVSLYFYLKGTPAAPVSGALPAPMTLPTFSAVPFSPTNIATPTPPATASSPIPAPATARGTYSARAPYLPYNPPGGIVINAGFGAPTPVLTQSVTGAGAVAQQNSCCDPCGGIKPKMTLSYARQISQSAVL